MIEPLVVQGASKGTSCSLLRAMTLTDVPSSNHDLMDELYSMKGIFSFMKLCPCSWTELHLFIH
jgi:hypothetical protein